MIFAPNGEVVLHRAVYSEADHRKCHPKSNQIKSRNVDAVVVVFVRGRHALGLSFADPNPKSTWNGNSLSTVQIMKEHSIPSFV